MDTKNIWLWYKHEGCTIKDYNNQPKNQIIFGLLFWLQDYFLSRLRPYVLKELNLHMLDGCGVMNVLIQARCKD